MQKINNIALHQVPLNFRQWIFHPSGQEEISNSEHFIYIKKYQGKRHPSGFYKPARITFHLFEINKNEK